MLSVQDKDDTSDSDGCSESDEECSKEASTRVGQKHKSDTLLEGEAKRGSGGSGGSPGANSAPAPGPVPLGATTATTLGATTFAATTFGAALGATVPAPITLTPDQLKTLQAIASKQYQTTSTGEYLCANIASLFWLCFHLCGD